MTALTRLDSDISRMMYETNRFTSHAAGAVSRILVCRVCHLSSSALAPEKHLGLSLNPTGQIFVAVSRLFVHMAECTDDLEDVGCSNFSDGRECKVKSDLLGC